MLALWAASADNGGVLTTAEPQVWTLLGALIVALFGMLTLMSTLFTRVIRTEIGGLRREMDARFDRVDARFDGVNTRFDSVNIRIDSLDRGVQALIKHTFGIDRA